MIWRDKAELPGNRVFRDTIAIGLTETGVFLSVLSPRYLDSPSCREELEGFLNAAPLNGGLAIGDRHRIFKVVKTPVDFTLHPEPIRDLLGYEFYAQDPINKRFREFDHEIGSKGDKDKRYWERLDDLAQDICALLKELQGAPAPKPGATIFLAQTTDDLMEQRDNVRRELRQAGHVILPGQAWYTGNLDILNEAQALADESKTYLAALVVWNGASRGADDVTSHFKTVAEARDLGVAEVLAR